MQRFQAPQEALRPLAELVSLRGRAAVVTGGARGIGRAVCARLAEAGAEVVAADLAEPAPAAPGIRAAHVDVTDPASVVRLAELAARELGRLDVWVNAAGIYPAAPLLELAEEEWDAVLDVNLRGTFLGAREAARAMIAAGNGGVIVNVTSTAAYEAGRGVAHYVSSKFGVRGLTKSLAVELGQHGIRALAVAPTVTLTEGLEERRAELEATGFQ